MLLGLLSLGSSGFPSCGDPLLLLSIFIFVLSPSNSSGNGEDSEPEEGQLSD